MKKVKTIFLSVAFAFAISACGLSVSDLEQEVLTAVNEKYGTPDEYATEITLVHDEGNNYSGIITMKEYGEENDYSIDVVYDGRSFHYEIY